MTLINLIKQRRKEAREIGKIIHPVPLLEDAYALALKPLTKDLYIINASLNFIFDILEELRKSEYYSSYIASRIVDYVLGGTIDVSISKIRRGRQI